MKKFKNTVLVALMVLAGGSQVFASERETMVSDIIILAASLTEKAKNSLYDQDHVKKLSDKSDLLEMTTKALKSTLKTLKEKQEAVKKERQEKLKEQEKLEKQIQFNEELRSNAASEKWSTTKKGIIGGCIKVALAYGVLSLGVWAYMGNWFGLRDSLSKKFFKLFG